MKELIFETYNLSLPVQIKGNIHGLSLNENDVLFSVESKLFCYCRLDKNFELKFIREIEHDFENPQVKLSPSSKFLLAISEKKDRMGVWDLESSQMIINYFIEPQGKHFFLADFAKIHDLEILIFNSEKHVLQGIELPNRNVFFLVDTRAFNSFRFLDFLFIERLNKIICVGNFFSEMNNSLILLNIILDSKIDDSLIEFDQNLSDYAWEIAVGKTNDERAVVYRVPDDEDTEQIHSELINYQGFYIIDLENYEIVKKIDIDLPVKTGSMLRISQDSIFVGAKEGFYLFKMGKDQAFSRYYFPCNSYSYFFPFILFLDITYGLKMIKI